MGSFVCRAVLGRTCKENIRVPCLFCGSYLANTKPYITPTPYNIYENRIGVCIYSD